MPRQPQSESQFTDSEAGRTLRRLSLASCLPDFWHCLTRDFRDPD